MPLRPRTGVAARRVPRAPGSLRFSLSLGELAIHKARHFRTLAIECQIEPKRRVPFPWEADMPVAARFAAIVTSLWILPIASILLACFDAGAGSGDPGLEVKPWFIPSLSAANELPIC